MYLYHSYCYPDLSAVIASLQSQVMLDGFGIIQSVNQISPGILAVDYQIPDGSINVVNITLPTCDRPGFDNSYTGIGVDDAVELGGMILLALTIAYCSKIIRRAL